MLVNLRNIPIEHLRYFSGYTDLNATVRATCELPVLAHSDHNKLPESAPGSRQWLPRIGNGRQLQPNLNSSRLGLLP